MYVTFLEGHTLKILVASFYKVEKVSNEKIKWENQWKAQVGSSSAVAAKSFQSCPTLRDPMDCSLPGSSVPGISQARILEWVAIAFSSRFFNHLQTQSEKVESAIIYFLNGGVSTVINTMKKRWQNS